MPLIVVCAAALFGIAVADLRQITVGPFLLAGALGVCGVLASWRQPISRTLSLVAVAAVLGALRATALPPVPLPMFSLFDNVRASARAGITRYLPEPSASLAAGILLGGSGHLSSTFRGDLQRSGLSHLVAIDGFKQIVVATAVRALTSRLAGARVSLFASLAAIAAYTLLAGAHPSALRAALMVSMANLAALSGRLPDPLTSLLLATLALAMAEPRVLLDLGLQLSLSATLGIILLWPLLRACMNPMPRFMSEPVGLSVAVTLATLPVTLSVFHTVSLISPFAHMLAVPLLPLVFVGTALLAASSAFPPLAIVAAWAAWLPSALLAAVVHLFGALPGAALTTGQLSLPAACALAAALLACGLCQVPEIRSGLTTFAARRESAG